MVASVAPPGRAHRHEIGAILGCLVASAVSLALAPALMPESYSWVSHTTSPRGPASPSTRPPGDSSIGFYSIGMAIWGDSSGALQRTMFLVLYTWYASEAIRAYRFEKVTQGE